MAGVNVKFGADTSELDSAVNHSKSRVGELSGELRSGITTVAKYGAAAAAAAAGGLTALAVQGLKAVDAQAKLARSLQGTVDQVQALNLAASDAGLDDMEGSLNRLNRRLGAVEQGGGEAAKALKRVGLDARELAELPLDERMAAIADAFKESGISAQEAARAAQNLGFEQKAAGEFFLQGGDAIRNAREEIDAFGLSISQVEAAQVEAANDAFSRVSLQIDGVRKRLAVELAPVITAISTAFTDAAKEAGGVASNVENFADRAVSAIAFVADAVEGVRRTFEVAGKGVALFGLSVTREMLSAADTIVNEPIEAINELIKAFNRVPGINIEPVGLTGLGESVREQLATTESAIEIAKQDIHDTLMAPLPGTRIKEAIEEARKQSEEAARAIAETNENIQPQQPRMSAEEEAEAEAHRKQLQERIQRIRESQMSEVELIRQRNEETLEALREGLEAELLTREEYDELREEQERAAQERITEIEEAASERRKKLVEQEAKAKRDAFGSALGDMTTLMNTESRKMFEIGKAAALAQSTLNAFEAITGAYKVGANIGGPPLGAAFAAAASAAQFATIASIQSQSFGGGGGARGGAGSTTQNINADRERVGDSGGGSLILNVQGSGNMVDIEQIAQGLGSYLEDGGTIGSVQLRRS